MAEVQESWRKRLGRVRADSAIDRLIEALPGAPVITVRSAASLIGRSEQAVIRRLREPPVELEETVAPSS